MAFLSIAIVSHNTRDELGECLDSVFASETSADLEVIVADNASSDGSVAMLEERFPGLAVIPSQDNMGFARASNLCWRRATGELVLFLNSDTLLSPRALAHMANMMRERNEIAVLGPLLRNADGSIQMSFGDMMSLSAELRQKILDAGYRHGRGPLRRYVAKLHAAERRVDWVSGACLLTRRSWLERVDGFDESFFLYSEDVDLCARIRAAGGAVVFTPEIEIVHQRGRSTARDPDRAFVESQKSRLRFYAKHYGQPRLGLLKLYMTTKLGLAYLFRPSGRRKYRNALDLVFHGDGG